MFNEFQHEVLDTIERLNREIETEVQELKKLLLVPENTIGGLSHETYEG